MSGTSAYGTACENVQVFQTNRDGNWEIYRLGNITGQPDSTENVSQSYGQDISPSQSPDARWIAFSSNRDGNWEVYVAPVNGRAEQSQRITYNTTAIDTDPMWGPNNHLVYESTRDGNWEIYIVDLLTGLETRLTDNPGSDINPSWSTDGSKILFQSDRGGFWQIYELDLNTAHIRALGDGMHIELDPQYSPDGKHILFRSYRRSNHSTLYMMNADGSGLKIISDFRAESLNASWAPDGSRIAYQSDQDGDLDVYVFEIRSGRTRQLTDNTIADYAPTWVCGGSLLLFTSEIKGNADIFSAAASNINDPPIRVESRAQNLTNTPYEDIYPVGAPAENNAASEGILTSRFSETARDTRFPTLKMASGQIDPTLPRPLPWRPISGGAPAAEAPLYWKREDFPVH